MWKAAFTGRSESGGGTGSTSGRPDKDEPRRKKSSHSHRAESVISSTSRRDDKERERRRREKAGSLYDNASSSSRYENGSSYTSGGVSQYATAPSSRVGEPRPLTESALRMLPDDEEEWEDDEKDARSEKRSRRRESGDEKRRKSTRSEKERSRSRSRERKDKKRESKSDKSRDKEKVRSRRDPELVSENSRAIPEMGSFQQFPGQFGPSNPQDVVMSGALPSPAPNSQFVGQEQYAAQPIPPGPNRADSWGAAAEYYLDEGQSVNHQPGVRPLTPNMLVNPDLDHLMAASAQANPVADTGNGSAADFFSGKVSPVPYETPQKPTKPGKQSSSGKQSSTSKPSKPSRTSSTGAAAAALAAAGIGAMASSSKHHHSSSQQQTSTSSSSKPTSRPTRHSSDGGVYYATPSSNGTYPPTLPSTNGYGPGAPSQTGTPGKRPTNNSNVPLYAGAAAAAGAAGYAAYEHNQHSQYNNQQSASYNMAAAGGYGGGGQGPPRSPQPGPGGYGYYPPHGSNGGMAQMPYHEHKGPMTRLKDGLLNLISTPEDTAKMEMYTEYIGVCKHCFDPRTSAWDAPRVHHYHKRSDSFEDLRRRRSYDKMRRRGSDESLRRQGSTRVDKENRYYASDSSRKKRESGGAGILGAGLAAAGAAGVANAMFSDRKDFDDTYSVKSGHRESSAVRRRSRSSSREQRRRSSYGVSRPEKDEYVTVRKKDGTIERRKVARKSRSSSRDRKSSGLFGAAATGAALGAAGMAASSRRRHSRSRSPSVLGGSDSRSRRKERRSPNRASYYNDPRRGDRPPESEGLFGGFFSPPKNKRRNSREHQKKRRGFFTFSNSSESSHDDLAFGEGFSSRTSLPLRRKSSTMSNRSGRAGRRISKNNSDDHLAATVAGIGATAAALAAAQKGHRISKRSSRPELGKRREPRYDTHDSTDDEWEDELPSDVDDDSSVDGGLAFGDYGGKRLSSRQSMESVGSQSSAGGPLSAWGWRWGNKEQKKRGRRTSSDRPSFPANGTGSFVAPGLSNAGSVSGVSFDPSRPINRPVYLDDSGRPLPSISSESTVTSGQQGPMQYVDPAPLSDAGSRHPSMPGAFDYEPPVIRPGPGPIQQPQPITPIPSSFTQSPPDINARPSQPRRANSSPTRGHFAQDAALIGAAALGTAGIIAGSSMMSGKKSREPSNVRFGLTEEQQRKDDRDQRNQQKIADEERRKSDRTRALKEEAERAAKESRQEEIRQAREDENRRRAEEKLREQREAEARAESQRQREQARIERERLEKEARDRKEAAAAAAAEVERLRLEREEYQRQADQRERERREREEAYARDQRRQADERERYAREQDAKDREVQRREQEDRDRYERERREQEDNNRYERGRRDNDGRQSSASKWAPVAVGAAAAATVGAAIASEKGRDRKRRDDSYYDEAHSDRQQDREYGTAEVKPKWEHDGEPIMDDDIFDPELFKRNQRDSSSREELENDPRYIEFARRAADKIAAERGRAYSPAGKDKYTTYADFFMPEELLNKTAEPGNKVRDVSPHADNEIAVWHAREEDIRSHFPQHPSDYGYGRSKHAPYGVPKLNVISPTPPPGTQSPTSARSSKGSKSSPLSKTQDADEDEVPEDPNRSQSSGKSERSRSISWGEDKTHFYDVDTPTPESHMDRDSYITSPDMRGQKERVAAGVAGAAAAGAALHDIIVEEPSGESHRYSEEEWRRDEENEKKTRSSRGRKKFDDDDDVEDIVPSPEPEPDRQGFYRQPFFDSVSDMGTGIFNIDSPGTEGAPPVQGFVEDNELDETPANEKVPHIPGGFDDDDDPVSAEVKKEQAAQASAGASKDAEEPAWEPPLSKKEKKKREKAAKRSDSIAESDPPTPLTETPASNGDPRDIAAGDDEYFPPLSKKHKKKKEKEAKKQGVGFADLVSQVQADKPEPEEPRRDEQSVDDWQPPLSKKEQKKREKEAKKQGVGFADLVSQVQSEQPQPEAARREEPVVDDWEPPLSKKEQKKRDKEAKQGVGFADLVSQVQSEETRPEESRREEPSVDDWELPLSKKEQKKRDKEAKKSGFADVADEILAAGGIAAAAAAATGIASAATDSTEESTGGSGSSKKKKKGKKAKLGEPLERDPRDLELTNDVPPAVPEAPSFTEEPSSMPGAWDDERRDSTDQSPVETSVDPFQYEVPDPETAAQERPDAKEVDSWTEWNEPSSSKKSKKDKKKAKRGSAAFDTFPEVSSPLRAEVPQDDFFGGAQPAEANKGTVVNGNAAHVNGTSSEKASPEAEYRDGKRSDDRSGRPSEYFDEDKRVSESPRRVSPDDVRSVTSTSEVGERRRSQHRESRRGSDYADEPAYAYETQSVAASEPADPYDREKKSKRRSRHGDDFDDTASVTSIRSRRDKEESPSSSKKESKGGLFGLFSRKSVDEKSSKDGSSLSRKSTRDEEDEKSRRRKHRSTSEYGDDDDDTRSVKSESRRKHRSHSEHGDEESRERRKRSSRTESYDEYDRDRASPARSEPASSSRHHHRRRTEDDDDTLSRKDSRESRGAVSESGHRHHHRRRTDEDYDSKDQSFLGNRVEDLPPLPASPVESDSAAALEAPVQREQGEGSPVFAESAPQASVNDGKVDLPKEGTRSTETSEPLLQTPAQSAPSLETPQRPTSQGRPMSSTAVPLRFPFGHAPPQTPASLKERAHSFSSPLATPGTAGPSPVSPASTSKQSRQGRPHSTEIRPLYLVERNRQTPEVDEALPSLPSSKPSSRASSIHGSDENYQSAAEDWSGAESPSRRRALTVDIGEAQRWKDEDDVLNSQETTPRASEFPQLPTGKQQVKQEPQFYTWEDLAREEQPKQQPQFYTWEDFAADEKMHEKEDQPQVDPEAAYRARVAEHEELPPLPRSRSVSPAKKQDHGHRSGFKSVAAAAMLGTAAVYAGHKLSERSPDRASSSDRERRRGSYEPVEKEGKPSYPLPAPLSPVAGEGKDTSRPELSRKASKKKKGKKGKKSQQQDDEPETPATPLSEAEATLAEPLERQDTDTFFDAEARAESGEMGPEPISEIVASAPAIHRTDTDTFWREEGKAEEGVSHPHLQDHKDAAIKPKENALDRFLHDEKDMEEGGVLPSAAAHSMPVYSTPSFSDDRSGQFDQGPGDDVVYSSSASHTMPVLPTPGEESTERFMEGESRMEDGGEPSAPVLGRSNESNQAPDDERPSTSYKIPGAKAEPAPLVIEPRSVVVDHEQPTTIEPTPQLTRKQSKKAKKKQKAAALFTGEPGQDDEESPVPEAVPEEKGIQPWEDSEGVDTPATAIATAPPIDWGTSDFGNVARQTSSSWHDAQSQAFADFMAKPESPETAQVDDSRNVEPEAATEEATAEFEPAISKKKAKKDKKKKPPTWSEFGGEDDAPTPPQEDDVGQDESRDGLLAGAAIGAAATAAAPAVFEAMDSKSKKKAKKDKKKKPPTWSEPDAEVEQAPEQQPFDEVQAEAGAERDVEPEQLEKFHEPHEDKKDETLPEEPAATSEPIVAPDQSEVEPSREINAPADAQATDDFAPILSRKQSKKDKKNKKKASLWSEPAEEADPAPPTDVPSEATWDDGAEKSQEPTGLDTNEATSSTDVVKDAQVDTESGEVAESPAPADDDDAFAPVSKKKSKKDKKKAKQTFDWTEPEEPKDEEAIATPAVDEATPAADVPEPQTADTSSAPAAVERTIEEQPEPARDIVDTTPATGEIAPVDESAAQSALEEFAPAVSKKQAKKDKKKKRQTFDFTEAEPESTPAPEPEVDLTSKPEEPSALAQEEKDSQPAEKVAEQSGDGSKDVALEPQQSEEPTGLVTAAAEIIQPEQTDAKSALEEFAPVSSKKSKKDKKKKRNTFDWTDPEPEPEVQASQEPQDEPSTAEQPVTSTRDEPAATESVEDQESTPAQKDDELLAPAAEKTEEAADDDFKPSLSRKQSKKDKKKKRNTLDWTEPEPQPDTSALQEPSTSTQPEPTTTETVDDQEAAPSLQDQDSEVPAPAVEKTEETADDDFKSSLSRKQSKKDKKKKRQSLAWEPEAETHQESTFVEGAEKPADRDVAETTSSQPEDVPLPLGADDGLLKTDQPDEAPNANGGQDLDNTFEAFKAQEAIQEPTADSEVQPAEEPQEESAWTTGSSKKSKKGKKGKKSASETPTPAEPGSSDLPAPDVSLPTPQSWDDMVAEEQEIPQSTEKDEVSTPAPEADTAEFSWAPSSKKKGKKGKKSRQPSLADTKMTDNEPSSETQSEARDLGTETEQPGGEEAVPESWAAVPGEVVAEPETTASAPIEGEDLEAVHANEDAQDNDATPAEQPEDDWWSFPSSSKKKKGKKSKSSSGIATPAEPEIQAFAEQSKAADASQEQTTSAAETLATKVEGTDDTTAPIDTQEEFTWAPSSKKKKGKKSKSSSGVTTPAEPETKSFEEQGVPPTDVVQEPPAAADEPALQTSAELVEPAVAESEAQEEFSWAPSSKKSKKGKKGKASSTQTPVAETADPLDDWTTPSRAVEHDETAPAPEKQFQEQPANADLAEEDEWALPTSSKKKKKGKKSASGLPTAIAELVDSEAPVDSTAAVVEADNHEAATESTTDAAKDEDAFSRPQDDTAMPDAWGPTDQEVSTRGAYHEANTDENPPANRTFDDIWAEEDITTAEDHDTVRDLMDDSRDNTEPFLASSKKGKKKKGKKGSIAEPKLSVEQPLPAEKEAESEPAPVTAEPLEIGENEKPDPIEAQRSEEPSNDTAISDTAQTPAENDEPDSNAAEFWMPQTSKKKGKKGKKGKQLSMSEEPSTPIDDTLEVGADPAVGDTAGTPSTSKEPDAQNLDAAVGQIAEDISSKEQDNVFDDWSAPSSGSKKKKSKNSKQTAFAAFDDPETSAANESKDFTADNATIAQPATTDEMAPEAPVSAVKEAEDPWELPIKGKKAKQVLSWGDETPIESPAEDPSLERAEAEQEPVAPEASWEIQEDTMREADKTDDKSATERADGDREQSLSYQENFKDVDVDRTRDESFSARDTAEPTTSWDTPDDWSQQVEEPKEIETAKTNEVDTPAVPESSKETQPEEDFGFSVKKSKKDKKKGKKSRSSTTDPWAETSEAPTPVEEPAVDEDHSSGLGKAAVAATAIAAAAAVAGAAKTEPEEDEWASFSTKKSKKAKKKDRKSGSSTPALQQQDGSAEPRSDVVDFAPEPPSQEDLEIAANTGLPEVRANEQHDLDRPAQQSMHEAEWAGSREPADVRSGVRDNADRSGTWDEATTTSTPHHPSQDIDFTATVAAGLADSGFNPDMVINDPVFHRRASPPGAVAEADPEEGFATTTRRRKKNRKSSDSPASPVEEPANPAEPVTADKLDADDFNSAISRSLQGTGFDPALLEQALASSNEASKDVAEPEEFSFATAKRKKGKKGKKAQREAEELPAGTDDTTQATNVPEESQRALTGDGDEQQAMILPPENNETAAENAPADHGSDSRGVDILTVGRDEMDMDEMDRAYKAYKKNKRKQKKLKAASMAAGASDNPDETATETEQSALVSEAEGLSRNTTMENVLGPSSSREAPQTETRNLPEDKPSIGTEVAVESAKSPTSPQSTVQSAFPGLERVKRRAPPKPEPKEEAPSDRTPSPPRADPAFGTAGMAAVVAAAARDRQARKESKKAEKARETPRDEPSWSFAALNDQNKQEPESPVVGSREHQPIRDSGYQETARSTERSSREIPQILSTSSSRDSLRERRSLEPLQIPMSPQGQWDLKVPKKRSKENEDRREEARSRTPSAETPLKPTSKDRASYLFQSPPEGLAGTNGKSPQPIDAAVSQPPTDNSEYFRTRSRPRESPDHPSSNTEITRDRSAFSPSSGPLSPRQALDSIPEEHHVGKRNHAVNDVGGPDHIKAIKRAETPQDIRIREQAISPSMRPHVTIPSGSMRSTSNPLSTDELINRLSWPSVDENDDTVNLSRSLGHRHSKPALPDPRSPSVMSNRSNASGAHFKSPQELRSYSRNSNQSHASSTHSLRRVSLSGDLRAASRRGDAGSSVSGARASPITIPFEPPPTPPLNDDDVVDGSASRAVDMNDDVFVSIHNIYHLLQSSDADIPQQGYGDAQGSQVSPTRPPSVRKRQSMHINDLESRLDQLAAENRALQEARSYAEQTNDAARDVNGQALQEAIMQRDLQIQEKDAEINKIKAMLQPLQEEIARLSEMNSGLTEANRNLVDDTNGRYATLQREHHEAHEKWQSASRDLDTMRSEHGRITSGMKDIVEAEIATALADKNAEILRLREQLDIAAEQIRALQVQIQSSKTSDFLIQRDEDYFDGSCQKLCQHVQQWVLRFSKLSDNRVCRLSTELNDDKIEARLDNAVLDGSDVDKLLGDRVRRRDVFMSVVMTMVWEYVFTRYLFGMDREQRQKLKALEKLLAEVGPPRAVAHWRATTLTLLSKRPSFESQCALDTEAVAHEVFGILCKLLPPPSQSEQQLLASLTKVIRIAVDLSVEMRTQRAEYIMLPPLQPEYDMNGDLVRKVHFNASLMNERSGFFSSNEELAAEHAVVKIVLFPLVVKKGDEVGEGEEEIVVCPAQVLVHSDGRQGKKVVRVMSGAMEIDDPIRSRQSRHSLMSEAPGSVQF
ncbi:hypothetical protein PRZ48_010900 [Zasmidium cellare]|uniref:Involucrin repeat protein n=1 Tax=Zasmidium cellare TaxID=395010 RepID=A0ABR0E9Y0_ZASCE|nr:hypothetical protein PRZ48_010900 [Zasmidium cellare]